MATDAGLQFDPLRLAGARPERESPRTFALMRPLAEPAPVIALDGKTLRGSLDRFEDRKAAQVLSAFIGEAQMVLGQILIEDADKDHEIQATHRNLGAEWANLHTRCAASAKKPLKP